MKNLFKILTLIMVCLFTVNVSFAFPVSKLDKYVKKSSLNDSSMIAISVRNVKDGTVVYEQNPMKLVHPA